MPRFVSNLFVDGPIGPAATTLFLDEEVRQFNDAATSPETIITPLALKVRTKPRDLVAHLRRIYCCYEAALSDQLYAALLDLLWVLDGRGRALSQRVIRGSGPRLAKAQLRKLEKVEGNPCSLRGNRYSLFTTGLIGSPLLIEVKPQSQAPQDWLTLAEDFIQYSQLDQAMTTLEEGLQQTPERQDLQQTLLELYRSTANGSRFRICHDQLRQTGVPLLPGWQDLAATFAGMGL